MYPAWEPRPLLKILRFVLAIALVVWLFRQVRKPSGWLGRRVVRAMNLGHAKMTDWALQQVNIPKNAAILDIGCRGGWTVRKLATLASEGKVTGLDYSDASVAVSRDTKAKYNGAWRWSSSGMRKKLLQILSSTKCRSKRQRRSSAIHSVASFPTRAIRLKKSASRCWVFHEIVV